MKKRFIDLLNNSYQNNVGPKKKYQEQEFCISRMKMSKPFSESFFHYLQITS